MNQHHWGQCYKTFLLHKAVFPLAKILGKTASDSDTQQSLLYFALATLGDTTQIEMMLFAKDGRESILCRDIVNKLHQMYASQLTNGLDKLECLSLAGNSNLVNYFANKARAYPSVTTL